MNNDVAQILLLMISNRPHSRRMGLGEEFFKQAKESVNCVAFVRRIEENFHPTGIFQDTDTWRHKSANY